MTRWSTAPLLTALASALLVAACSAGPAVHPTTPTTTPTTTSTATVPTASRAVPAPSISTARRAVSVVSSSPIPPVSAAARKVGLVDVRTIVPDAVIDLRYATTNNFTHVRLYPRTARCLVHTSMRAGLSAAAAALRAKHDVLVFWDCYRPHAVQVRMFTVVPDPNFVARPGSYSRSHETGRSVDVTVARRTTGGSCTRRIQGHCLLDMGTGFDSFSARAHAYATGGVSRTARQNRALLRTAMRTGRSTGLAVYSGEWWHFDGPGAFVHRRIVNVPLT